MESSLDYNARNDETRAQLRALIGRLSDAELQRSLGDGWTVSAMLAHLAFYDARAIALLRRYQASGEVTPSPLDSDVMNDAVLPLSQVIPARAAADMALRLAEECDRAVRSLSPELANSIEQAGWPVKLQRWDHRAEHIEQIESALRA